MMLLTKANRNALIKNFETNAKTIAVDGSTQNFKPVVKLFNPTGVGTWLLTELDPETNIAFGLCDIGYPEIGYVSLDELSNVRLPFGLSIERDRHWKASKTLSEYADTARSDSYPVA
jgi:hypothetical protein